MAAIRVLRSVLAGAMLLSLVVAPAQAKVRIYGGPVSSAGSGQYYPPFGNAGTVIMYGADDSSRAGTERPRLDLNPFFTPGSDFRPPGYVPKYFARPEYLAYDDFYVGYGLESAMQIGD